MTAAADTRAEGNVRGPYGANPGACSPAALRTLLATVAPVDAREEDSLARFRRELDRLEHPCDRHADPVHVTASAIIVGTRGTVLHLHRRLRRWLQVGGHLEDGEGPAAAAEREAHEETGLPLRVPEGGPVLIHVDVHPAALGHTHLDLRYLLVGGDEDPRPSAGESPEVRWFDWADAAAISDDSLRGALARARTEMETGTRAW